MLADVPGTNSKVLLKGMLSAVEQPLHQPVTDERGQSEPAAGSSAQAQQPRGARSFEPAA